jgi:hypothetical protein
MTLEPYPSRSISCQDEPYPSCINALLTMDRSEAEILALKALNWAAATEGTLQRFAAHTGVEIGDFRRLAGDLEFLAALLDFVLSDDSLAKAFCDEAFIETRQLHHARHSLPGGGIE